MKRPVAILRVESGECVETRELPPGNVPCDLFVGEQLFVLTNCSIADDCSVALEYLALPSDSTSPADDVSPELEHTALNLYNYRGNLEHTHNFHPIDNRFIPRVVAWHERMFLLTGEASDGCTYQEVKPYVLKQEGQDGRT